LDLTNHALQGIQGFTSAEITVTKDSSREHHVIIMSHGTPPGRGPCTLNLRIALARKDFKHPNAQEPIQKKKTANFQNKLGSLEGLKNQGIFGKVEGSKKWKHIALPKLSLSWNCTFGGLLAAFRGVRSFCLLPISGGGGGLK
jgi:hypothetical protein